MNLGLEFLREGLQFFGIHPDTGLFHLGEHENKRALNGLIQRFHAELFHLVAKRLPRRKGDIARIGGSGDRILFGTRQEKGQVVPREILALIALFERIHEIGEHAEVIDILALRRADRFDKLLQRERRDPLYLLKQLFQKVLFRGLGEHRTLAGSGERLHFFALGFLRFAPIEKHSFLRAEAKRNQEIVPRNSDFRRLCRLPQHFPKLCRALQETELRLLLRAHILPLHLAPEML